MKLLAVGDMHLGAQPSRLPVELGERALGPAASWSRLVDEAVERGVSALVLAGDLVERERDFFEAYRELYSGVARLREAGIEVLAVAGNHDVQVLPRLAAEIPGFRLLGKGGQWEMASIGGEGEKISVWGWSYPSPKVFESPLAGARLTPGPGLTLGLLHCDRDQSGSPYAPVSSRALEVAGLDGWLLGHVHRPDPISIDSPFGYLGSVAGVDPGEPGARGPWLYTIEGGSIVAVEQWELSPLRWERLSVDLTGLAAAEDASPRLLQALRSLDDRLSTSKWRPEAVGLRITLEGCTGLGSSALAVLTKQDDGGFVHVSDSGTCYFIEKIRSLTRPEIPIEQLAGRRDPAGLLAQRLTVLDRPPDDPARRALIERATKSLAARAGRDAWSLLERPSVTEAETADYLRAAAMRLLERMLAETEAGR